MKNDKELVLTELEVTKKLLTIITVELSRLRQKSALEQEADIIAVSRIFESLSESVKSLGDGIEDIEAVNDEEDC